MTEKNEALRLADSISRIDTLTEHQRGELLQAAAELRRLADIERRFYELQRHGVSRAVCEKVEAQRDALLKMLKDVLPVAEDASESLGRFCGDEGWAQVDMDRMDNVDGMLPLIRAAIAAVEGEKE